VATNRDLDDKLIETARQLGGHKTKRDAVTRALEEYVGWLRQQAIVSEFGKIDAASRLPPALPPGKSETCFLFESRRRCFARSVRRVARAACV